MNRSTVHRVSEHCYQIQFFNQEATFIESVFWVLREEGCNPSMVSSREKPIVWIDFSATMVEEGVRFEKDCGVESAYCRSLQMIKSLYSQQSYLHDSEIGLGFYGVDILDILTIDDRFQVCIQSTLLKKRIKIKGGVDDDGSHFLFHSPLILSNSIFVAPEITSIVRIPARVHSSCFIYSLGALAVYVLFGKYIESDSNFDSDFVSNFVSNFDSVLKPIFQTKLYWMLRKALDVIPEKRVLLYL